MFCMVWHDSLSYTHTMICSVTLHACECHAGENIAMTWPGIKDIPCAFDDWCFTLLKNFQQYLVNLYLLQNLLLVNHVLGLH
jgi:hypothetical protein